MSEYSSQLSQETAAGVSIGPGWGHMAAAGFCFVIKVLQPWDLIKTTAARSVSIIVKCALDHTLSCLPCLVLV